MWSLERGASVDGCDEGGRLAEARTLALIPSGIGRCEEAGRGDLALGRVKCAAIVSVLPRKKIWGLAFLQREVVEGEAIVEQSGSCLG